MSGKRLTAAGVVLATLCVVAAASGRPTPTTLHHTCSLTDKQFIQVAQLNMASLGSWSQDYVNGEADAKDVVSEAVRAQERVAGTSPTDPSLSQTRALMEAMFGQYERAISAKQHHKDAGKYIFRAYGFANFAHDILVQAQPALLAHGCDIGPLL